MGPKEQIAAAFGPDKTLYEILGLAKDANPAAIRKAYFKTALTCHPDKCQGDPEATAKFQALSVVHATLSDPEKRRLYDETGEVEEEGAEELSKSEQEWYDYFRALFPKVTLEKIAAFQREYQGSQEEREDVLRAYVDCQGKMARVIDCVMLANDDDEARFREVIEAAIKAKEVPRFKGFKAAAPVKADAKRQAKASKEAAEAEALLKAIQEKRGTSNALATMAQDRKKQMDSFLDDLEAKYAGGGGGKGKGKGKGAKGKKREAEGFDDVDEEEFARIQAGLKKGKGRH